MTGIDRYINTVYAELEQTPEVAELKEEMRHHLMESVRGLQSEGHSEKESVRLAIERFGESGGIAIGLNSLYGEPVHHHSRRGGDVRAWLALVFGCLALVSIPLYPPLVLFLSMAGFILGFLSRRGDMRGVAIAGIILSTVATGILILFMLLIVPYFMVKS